MRTTIFAGLALLLSAAPAAAAGPDTAQALAHSETPFQAEYALEQEGYAQDGYYQDDYRYDRNRRLGVRVWLDDDRARALIRAERLRSVADGGECVGVV